MAWAPLTQPIHGAPWPKYYFGSITSVVNDAPRRVEPFPAMNISIQLGNLQLAIMRVLWERGEATVAEVHKALEAERGLALTTIATMLSKMERKGVVHHRTEGRQFVYQPTIREDEVRSSMVSEFTERLFKGDAAALVNHLLTEQQIDHEELLEITRRIEERARRGEA